MDFSYLRGDLGTSAKSNVSGTLKTALPLIFKRFSKDLDTMEEEKALHVSRASHPGIKVKSYG
jgi:hypothetical protein